MKKVISILIIFSVFLSFTASSFANLYDSSSLSSSAKHNNTEIEPYNRESVVTYIDKAYEIESIEIDGTVVNYYVGKNFTVVEEGNKYYLIQRDEEDFYNVTVNNIKIETVISEQASNGSGFDEFNRTEMDTLSSDWKYMHTRFAEYNVAFLPITVGVALVIGIPSTKTGAVIEALSLFFGQANFPYGYYLTDRKISHYRLSGSTTEWRTIHQLFHGPSSDKLRHHITSWSVIQRR